MRQIYLSILFSIFLIIPKVQSQSVTDYDENQYPTVIIGLQEWFTENLKTTHYSDGTPVIHAGDNSVWENNSEGAYSWYSNEISWKEAYGALYNWHAVNNQEGLCPAGWRVPSIDDWDYLTSYLTEFGNHDINTLSYVLRSRRQVDSPWGGEFDTDVHPRWNAHSTNYGNDDYGFSALPGGQRMETGNFGMMGTSAAFWFSDESSTAGSARAFHFSNFNSWIGTSHSGKNSGYSVRCIRDVDATLPETGSIVPITQLSATSAKSGGDVTNEGNVKVTARGVVWSTTTAPTIESNTGKTTDGTGAGEFTSRLVGLTPQTTYYVRAYATNAAGTVYSNEIQFTTPAAVTTIAVTPSGTGTQSDPYLISTLENLLWISESPDKWNQYFKQTSNIDASPTSSWSDGKGWQPIGTETLNSFTGEYDGNGHIIDGLFVNRPSSNGQGLFGYITNGAVIKNIGVTNVFIRGGDWYTGALVGYSGASHVSGSFSTGVVQGTVRDVGGLVGRHHYMDDQNSSITNSYSHCSVKGIDRVGGLIGKNSTGSLIINSYSTGYVEGNGVYVGGVAGRDLSSSQEPVSNYWDMELSGMEHDQISSGKTSNQMKLYSTFLWWDFKGEIINGTEDVWNIGNGRNNGYPYLTWQYPDDPGISAAFSGGDGTFEDPYLISSAEELNLINFQYLNNSELHFALISDIDLNVSPFNEGQGWVPIGTNQQKGAYTPAEHVRAFKSSFYGNGFTVNGLRIERLYNYQGLFGYLQDAYIENLGVLDLHITGGHRYIGGLAGYSSGSEIFNCYTTGTVEGMGELFISPTAEYGGGLVGYNLNGAIISNSFSSTDVSGYAQVGGLVGINSEGATIQNSNSSGMVTSRGMSGGFVGINKLGAVIENCYSRGDVIIREGDQYSWVGGFIGGNSEGVVKNSYSTGTVTYLRGGNPENKGFAGGTETNGAFYMAGNYWDIDSSGQSASSCNASGVSTDAMTYPYETTVYDEWDFDEVWNDDIDFSVNSGYPVHFLPDFSVTFKVIDQDGEDIINSIVTLGNITNSSGNYSFEKILPGYYRFLVSSDGYVESSGMVQIIDQNIVRDVTLITDLTFSIITKKVVVNVFPNPAGSFLNISSDELIERVTVLNLGGQVVSNITVNNQYFTLNIGSLRPGIYLVKIVTGNSVITERISKQ